MRFSETQIQEAQEYVASRESLLAGLANQSSPRAERLRAALPFQQEAIEWLTTGSSPHAPYAPEGIAGLTHNTIDTIELAANVLSAAARRGQ